MVDALLGLNIALLNGLAMYTVTKFGCIVERSDIKISLHTTSYNG